MVVTEFKVFDQQVSSSSRTEKGSFMGRPFFPHEADDPDLDWLVSNFLYERPDYVPVESGMLPLILLPYRSVSDEETKPEPDPNQLPVKTNE